MSFIYVPFSYLMKGCLFISGNSYFFALFFFALAMQIILLPLAIKQQKSQIMMAKIKPKEMAIREKYKGRTDRVTQQKMTMEIQEMYQKNGYNQFGGCLPFLVQLPIILILFTIVRQPITYASNLPDNFVNDNIGTAVEFYVAERNNLTSDADKAVIDGYIRNLDAKYDSSNSEYTYSGTQGQYADTELSRLIIDGRENLEALKDKLSNYDEILAKYEATGLEAHASELPNYRIFSLNLINEPDFDDNLLLMIVPVLVFITSFFSTKLTRRLSSGTQTDMNGNPIGGGFFMEVGMPLISAIFAYGFSAAIGVYLVWKTLIGMVQTVALAKAMPIPAVTEEQIAEARREMKSKQKKKKVITIEVDEDDNSYDSLVVDKKESEQIIRAPRRIEMLTADDDAEENKE